MKLKKKIVIIIIALGVLAVCISKIANTMYLHRFGHFVKGPDIGRGFSPFSPYRHDIAIINNKYFAVIGHKRVVDYNEYKSHFGGISDKKMQELYNDKRYKPTYVYSEDRKKFTPLDIKEKNFCYSPGSIGLQDGNIFLYNSYYCNTKKPIYVVLNPKNGNIIKVVNPKLQRQDSAITLLKNGNVLMASGEVYSINSKSKNLYAEIYDYKNNIIYITKPMHFESSLTKAILLKDGNVVVIGNYPNGTAELYNSETNSFEPTGKLNIARLNPVVLRLNNGNVLVLGGRTNTQGLTSGHVQEAELYDAQTGNFKIIGKMTTRRGGDNNDHFDAILLHDGRVLISGGVCYKSDYMFGQLKALKSTEIYDPKTNKFERAADMLEPRFDHKMVLLENGDVMILGGTNCKTCELSKTTEIFKVKNKEVSK